MAKLLTAKDLEEGLYFTRKSRNPDPDAEWDLVYAQDASCRPPGWFKEGYPALEIYWMGWEMETRSHEMDDWVFVRAKFIHSDNPRIESE
jgi:hypothetical protein